MKNIFISHKIDFPDDGFSGRVVGQLPERSSILPQIVMVMSVASGMAIMFVMQSFTALLAQIDSLLNSINLFQVPSPSAVITCISALALTLMIGFSVAQVNAE